MPWLPAFPSVLLYAAAMGIEVYSLNFSLEGDLDLHAFLGLSEEKRAGYQNIEVKVNANTSAAAEEDFSNLMKHVIKTSPVLNILTNPVPVSIRYN